MISKVLLLLVFCCLDLFSYVWSTGSSQKQPDLSKFRDMTDVDASLNLSLSANTAKLPLSQSTTGKNHIRNVFDARTKEFKEMQKAHPGIDFMTEKQRRKQEATKTYEMNLLDTLKKENQLEAWRLHRNRIKLNSYKRRIERVGYGFGKQGELQRLKKKYENEPGSLSKEESERMNKLLTADRSRDRKGKRTQGNKTTKSPPHV